MELQAQGWSAFRPCDLTTNQQRIMYSDSTMFAIWALLHFDWAPTKYTGTDSTESNFFLMEEIVSQIVSVTDDHGELCDMWANNRDSHDQSCYNYYNYNYIFNSVFFLYFFMNNFNRESTL